MKTIKMAILGAGNIARTMAKTIGAMEQVECYAVASRDVSKAEQFAKEYGFQKAYGSYEELVMDSEIDLIYVATPHSHHYEHMKLCITHHKPVLCEKAFTANAKQAEEVLSLAKQEGIFVAEAIWTRYMPMLTTIKEILESEVIGKPHLLTCNLGYTIDHVARLLDPSLAGGALLDVGVYTLNFAAMMFGNDIEKVTSTCTYTDTGVDAQNSIILTYKDQKMAVLTSTMKATSDRKGIIYGEKGFIEIENINNYEKAVVYNTQYEMIATYERPIQITGFEYEVMASIQALEDKKIECEQMPHSEIIRMVKMMDSLREEWGIKYPFE